MKKLIIIFGIFIFCFTALFAQNNTKIKTLKLADSLYVIKAAGVNSIVLYGPDGILLVDDNVESGAQPLYDEIQTISKDKLNYIINTHWHFDHTEGNMVLGKGVTIIAHEYVKELLSKDEMLLGEVHKAYPEYALPSVTFRDKYSLSLNGESVEILALSGGHSAGDAIVYFKNANVLHIGDIVFADMFSFVDTEHGGNIVKLSENIQKIIDMYPSDVRIIPGHGRILTINDLKGYREMILGTTEIIRKEMLQNKSLEEIKSAKPLQAYNDWQVAFSCDVWIEIIYKSLK